MLPVMMWLSGCAGPGAPLQATDQIRDFPPLEDPNGTRPAEDAANSGTDVSSGNTSGDGSTVFDPSDRVRIPSSGDGTFDESSLYRLGVGDEMNVVVLGQPTYTRPVTVLPDGAISSTGTGTVYVLGMSVAEASQSIEERLKKTLRYPQVDLVVTKYGEHVVYVMGEVGLPADHEYRKGMTALQAVAAAGGFQASAKRTSVCVFRRSGPDVAEFIQLDLRDPLSGDNLQNDLVLRPYDIVFVPKSFIGNVNSFVDQYFRQNLSALNFYLTGWDAYSVTKDRVTIRRVGS